MRLEITHEDGTTQVFETYERNIIIGRSSKCEVSIPTESISRQHLRLEIKNGVSYITDLASSNGTFIHKEQLQPNVQTEWNVLFPIKIGTKITITLLPEKAILGKKNRPIPTSHLTDDKSDQTAKTQMLTTPSSKGKLKKLIIFYVLIILIAIIFYTQPQLVDDLKKMIIDS